MDRNAMNANETKKKPRNWRVIITLSLNLAVLLSLYNAVISVFLPNQVTNINPAAESKNLAIILTVNMLLTMFVQPIVGALSDRTRTRLGKRAPWILGGSIFGAVFLYLMSFQHTVLGITIFWILTSISLNSMNGPLVTTIADRFESNERGVVSGYAGAAQTAGGTLGIIIAGYLAATLRVGYAVFAIGIALFCILFVVINPEKSSVGEEIEPFNVKEFFSQFWVSPRENHDFWWAFLGRFFMQLGYQGALTYQLYILTHYIGLKLDVANHTIGTVSFIMMIGLLVSSIFSGYLSDFFNRKKIFVIIAALTMSVSLVFPLVIKSVFGVLMYAGIMGLGFGVYQSVDYALMTDVLPNGGQSAGKDLGILTIAQNAPQAFSPGIAAALLAMTSQNYASIFIFGIISVALSTLFILPIKSVR